MDGLSEQEALAAEWVANLRSRFESIGLSSRNSSKHDVKADEIGVKTILNSRATERGKPRGETERGVDPSAKCSDHPSSCENFQNWNSQSDDSEILEISTARTEASSSVDLERLRERRLAYFRQDVLCDGEDNDAGWRNISSVDQQQVQHSHNETEARPYSGDISENEFYSKPLLASSTSSWEKRCWSRTDGTRSPESDDVPRMRSNEDNIEFMLDWWGLKNDLSKSSELRMYLPKSKTKCDLSRKTNNGSENPRVAHPFDGSNSATGRESDSKEDFHVFPIGFDKDDAELSKDGFQNGVLSDGLYCSSDESSDFTLDDPVSKPKSPRAATCLLLGNSPRNSKPKLLMSTSPPVPQIKGSLYHEFSQKEVCGPSEKVPDKCIIAETDEFVNWGTCHRPRSLSQPNAVRDGIFCPDENDADIELLFNFLGKHTCSADVEISCKNNVNDMKDIIPEVSLKAYDVKVKEVKCANISPHFENASVSPRSCEKNCVPTVRVCPDCKEINSTNANWCIGCGLALVNVKPIKSIPRMKQADRTTFTSVNSEEVTQGLKPKKSPVDTSCVTDSSPSGKNRVPTYDVKVKEVKCANISPHPENASVSPRSGEKLGSEKNRVPTVRVCPDCKEINSTNANWCIGCGLALDNVKPIKSIPRMKQADRTTFTSVNSEEITQALEPKKSPVDTSCVTDSSPSGKNTKKNSRKEFKPNGRRWEKSSLAWNTYKDSHLSKPPGVKNFKAKSTNNLDASERSENSTGRPCSASNKHAGKKGTGNGNYQNRNNQHCDATGSCPRSYKGQGSKAKKRNSWHSRNSEMRVTGNKAMHETRSTKMELSLDLTALDDYTEMTQLIRSNRGNALPYLCLPDEIILRIFSHLSHTGIARCSQVCQQFNRICQDECLWKTIVLKKKQNMCDYFLEIIGSRKPVSLSLIQCRGNLVTSTGLRELFRRCAENLEELNFSGCNGGQLIGESILLHVALRCSRLRLVDASWSNVGDNGVEALVQNVDRLECLCLNGCQAITDNSLKVLADKHGESLRTFEIFGCFNVSASEIKRLGTKCPNLQTLNLGQCYKITSAAIGQLVSHLESIVNLDLRGCKQARDACVKTIAKHCPLLVNLVLANCPLITDVAMAEIAINLPSVRCLDVCGCVKVTDHGVKALARCCNRLNYLDLSSTSITQKSVMLLANYCSQNLESLKLSFCVDVTDDSVSRLVKHCKRMTTLHLYGCKRLRNVRALQKLNHSLKLEF